MIDLWLEGYVVTGNSNTASYCGRFSVDTIEQAVKEYKKVYAEPKYIDVNSLTLWGCRFFDNELDARNTFG